jgi:uncharacterized delta-60 repeat protein
VLARAGSSGEAEALALQADGKLVAVGDAWLGPDIGSDRQLMLVRYTARGRLDPAFGRGGMARLPSEAGEAVAIQSDGKIIVVGLDDGDFAVIRYTTRGKLDTTFGDGGEVLTNFGHRGPAPDESDDTALTVALQPDGKIVVAGKTDVRGASAERYCCIRDFALARYTPDGELDATFGKGGLVVTPFHGDVQVEGLALDARRRIVAAGGGSGYFALARYTPNGRLDQSFGRGGKVETHLVRR